jgi:hypothetical protein
MSDLGKIKDGSPRAFRDKIFGQRGVVTQLSPSQSVDGKIRYVFHPDDITDTELSFFIRVLEVREGAEADMEMIYKKVAESR